MAKLDARRIGAFLADPGGCRVALLHGDDPGLIRERCEALIRAVAEGDGLRLVEIGKETLRAPAVLANEAASSPLTGGRRAGARCAMPATASRWRMPPRRRWPGRGRGWW